MCIQSSLLCIDPHKQTHCKIKKLMKNLGNIFLGEIVWKG